MLIKRLYLRNYRVFEDELDLELPPGLVGIFGPNGAGKSTLLEAILWTLWGKARTTKEQIRTSGVGNECVTEVEFEHEGHLYLVRRVIKGINSSVSVEANCDGSLMATGTRDAQRYVESVLGMDDAAFRASVFTEQKQLAAFSDQTPAERRRLVLQLLGITPLDVARDAARKDARTLSTDHERLRALLPDIEALSVEVGDAEARAGAAEQVAAGEQLAAEAAAERSVAAARAFRELDERRQEHDALVAEGRAARQDLDGLQSLVDEQRVELAGLDDLAGALADLRQRADGLDDTTRRVSGLEAAATAAATVARVKVPPEPPVPDQEALKDATESAARAREALAASDALARAAASDLKRAKDAAARSASLSGEGDCPVCGQALGDAFEKVQAHRAREVAEAATRSTDASRQAVIARQVAEDAEARLAAVEQQIVSVRQARATWEDLARRREDAERRLLEAWSAVPPGPAPPGEEPGDGSVPDVATIQSLLASARQRLETQRRAGEELQRIEGKLERRPRLEASLATNLEKLAGATARVEALREKVKALAYDRSALDQAAAARDAAETAAHRAARAATDAAVAAAGARSRATGAAERLADARAQHDKLVELEVESRHVSRAADLLSDFRNTVVASVGPRLAAQAAELFAELTDREYEQLQVDADNYEVQIGDGGKLYGLDRFSGSEVDLANLAMRIAISEHIHFQSGGSVGLLVLDEVFGPLDQDRKERMLLALERLRGRFRQVLVVTHDQDIKEQLPNAVEVSKLPGRRATARLLGE